LAVLPSVNQVVSAAVGFSEGWNRFPYWVDRGARWFASDTGLAMRGERICSARIAFNRCDFWVLPTGDMGDVELLCGARPPTPTPTATSTVTATRVSTAMPSPSATPTPRDSVTASATPAATGTPPPTATAAPAPLYLPVALREHCDPVYERSDVALVIDTSSSMTGQKLEDAQEAALAFVRLIDLAPGRSQVAVVRFYREAEVVCELTDSRALIEAAVRNLQARSGTHIDKGLRTALGELQSIRHLERNVQVLIMLTDGVQTGTPGEELRAGEEVRAAGVRVYAIGVGADVDGATLRTIAGDDIRYYFAPDSADLARIYAEIARDLMCPGVDLWGGR
jgi:Mg-chelatase subunit ChlD